MQIPTIKLPGALFVTLGAWIEADASDRAAVVLNFGASTKTLDAEQSASFLETAKSLPLLQLPGGLMITAASWVMVETSDPSAVVITYGRGEPRTLDAEQSAEFLTAAGFVKKVVVAPPPGLGARLSRLGLNK
jgi:hypothetical protein